MDLFKRDGENYDISMEKYFGIFFQYANLHLLASNTGTVGNARLITNILGFIWFLVYAFSILNYLPLYTRVVR